MSNLGFMWFSFGVIVLIMWIIKMCEKPKEPPKLDPNTLPPEVLDEIRKENKHGL
jgi:hypothetical protein